MTRYGGMHLPECEQIQQQIQVETSIASSRTIQKLLLREETKTILSDRLAPYLKNPSVQPGDEFYQTLYEAIKVNCPEEACEFLK